MAEYWPSSLIAFMWTSTSSWFIIKTQNRTRPISSHLDQQAWSIKDLFYGQKITLKNFASAGTKREIPREQDRPILPACRASHIIIKDIGSFYLLCG